MKPWDRGPAIQKIHAILQEEKPRKILEDNGFAIGQDFQPVQQDKAIELPPPHILLAGDHQPRHGQQPKNLATAPTCYSNNGWGAATARLSFTDPALRSPYLRSKQESKLLVVTCDPGQEGNAKEWARTVLANLKKYEAPATFQPEYLVPVGQGSHAEAFEKFVRDLQAQELKDLAGVMETTLQFLDSSADACHTAGQADAEKVLRERAQFLRLNNKAHGLPPLERFKQDILITLRNKLGEHVAQPGFSPELRDSLLNGFRDKLGYDAQTNDWVNLQHHRNAPDLPTVWQNLQAQRVLAALTLEEFYLKVQWLFVLRNGDEHEYQQAKTFALPRGIQSQGLNASNLQRNTTAILANVTKQLGLNKEGTPVFWPYITADRMPSLHQKKILTIGIDLAHTPRENGLSKDSVACFVACRIHERSPNCITTYSEHTLIKQHSQSTRDGAQASMATDAEGMEASRTQLRDCQLTTFVTQSMQKFSEGEAEDYLPDVVVIYRDGLTETQLENGMAEAEEYNPIAAAMRERAEQLGRRPPKMVYSVINKSGRLRFSLTKAAPPPGIAAPAAAGRSAFNPPPGTVVDTTPDGSAQPQFHMIATNETISTAKPVRYMLVKNEGLDESSSEGIPLQDFRELSWALCFAYPNWNG